jgi:hypothetical protein
VPRVTSVRRSVTIATALVVSQALLCVIIGWVTFGHHDHSGSSSAEAAGPTLGPGAVVPPVQRDAVVGQRCHPAGADGTTRGGVAVRCRAGRSGTPIWQIN